MLDLRGNLISEKGLCPVDSMDVMFTLSVQGLK